MRNVPFNALDLIALDTSINSIWYACIRPFLFIYEQMSRGLVVQVPSTWSLHAIKLFTSEKSSLIKMPLNKTNLRCTFSLETWSSSSVFYEWIFISYGVNRVNVIFSMQNHHLLLMQYQKLFIWTNFWDHFLTNKKWQSFARL